MLLLMLSARPFISPIHVPAPLQTYNLADNKYNWAYYSEPQVRKYETDRQHCFVLGLSIQSVMFAA